MVKNSFVFLSRGEDRVRKGLLTLAVFLLPLFSVCCAGAEEAGGYVYSTDILTFVNGAPIEGYNIGGRTLVIAEELEDQDYGFTCDYNEDARSLSLYSMFRKPAGTKEEIVRDTPGRIVGEIFPTDITVTYNGIEVTGYNLGGRTAVCLEELGDLTDSPNAAYGYSKYLGKYLWDGENRTLSYDSYLSNARQVLFADDMTRLEYTFADNVLYIWPNDMKYAAKFVSGCGEEHRPCADKSVGDPYAYSETFAESRYCIQPLYLSIDGQKQEIGTVVSVYVPEADTNHTYLTFLDAEQAAEIIKCVRTPQKTYQEAYAYFTERFQVVDQIEKPPYTAMVLKEGDGGPFIVILNQNGGYVCFYDYTKDSQKILTIKWDTEKEDAVCIGIYPEADPHGHVSTLHSVWEMGWLHFD